MSQRILICWLLLIILSEQIFVDINKWTFIYFWAIIVMLILFYFSFIICWVETSLLNVINHFTKYITFHKLKKKKHVLENVILNDHSFIYQNSNENIKNKTIVKSHSILSTFKSGKFIISVVMLDFQVYSCIWLYSY